VSGVGAISLPAVTLARAIASVLPHVSKDKTRPSINSVHVRVSRGHIMIEATDRYTMAIHRTPAVAKVSDDQVVDAWWDGDLDVMIGADDAKRVMVFAKGVVGALPVTITVSNEDWADVTVAYAAYDESIRLRTVHGDFPNIERLVPPAPDQHDGHVAFGAGNMAKVTASALALKQGKDVPPVVMLAGKNAASPCVFTIGDDLIGMLMPVRVDEPRAARAAWSGLL